VADNIIPLIVKLHQFKPLADALSFQVFPPDEPHSFKLRFDNLHELDKRFKPFITKFVYLIFIYILWGLKEDVVLVTYQKGVHHGTYSSIRHLPRRRRHRWYLASPGISLYAT
jgi:hypothetical protein